MSVQVFVLEPAPGAKVRLRPVPGGPPVADDDLRQLEQELRNRFESLVMTTEKTVQVQGREFHLEKEATEDPRMPRLVLTAATATTNHAMAQAGSWRPGLLAELRQLADDLHDAPHHERGALRGCADELSVRLEEAPGSEAGLLLMTYLATAEAHFRATDADRAGQYALALRALRRRLPRAGEELQVPAASTEVPAARSFLGECFAWIFGK
jgi:hypothetical protein